jgi:hypothetical protein
MHVELFQNMMNVVLHGGGADAELTGDLLVGAVVSQGVV